MSYGFLEGVSRNRNPLKDMRRLSRVRSSGRGVTRKHGLVIHYFLLNLEQNSEKKKDVLDSIPKSMVGPYICK